jgi:hypothetical protein
MDKEILEFVKDLIEHQRKAVERTDEKDAGTVAAGLFGNSEFCTVIIELFHPGYANETKRELPSDTKNRVLYTLDEMIDKIDSELTKHN